MKCNINGCENEASKDISRLGKTALCERHLAIKTDQNMIKARSHREKCEQPGCSYLRALYQRYCPAHMLQSPADSQLQSDIQEMQQGNKRADRNQFAAPRRDGKLLELAQRQYGSLISDIMTATGRTGAPCVDEISNVLNSYGIVGGAK